MISGKGVDFRETDCLTLITEIRSYCLIVSDDTLRYDLYLALSWNISIHATKTSLIPITKPQLSVYIVRKKIEAMAKERLLFVEELYLLGIYKYLVQTGAEEKKKKKIWKMIQGKLLLHQKMIRIFRLMKPRNFMLLGFISLKILIIF